MRRLVRHLLPLLVLGLLAGCTTATAGGAAATVDGVEIPHEQLESAVRELAGDVESLSPEEREERVGGTQRQILTFLIQAQVLASLADDRDVEVGDQALADARGELIASIGGEEQLEPVLSQAGLTAELFEDVFVPQQAQLTALRAQLAGDTVETRTVRHILVDSENEADELAGELEQGADFAELAAEHSLDTGSGAAGGELGQAPRGAYVPGFEDAVWSAEIGELVGPVESDFGYHLLEVTDEATVDADELAPQQLDQLVAEEFGELVDAAFEDAEVRVADGLGTWSPEQRQVVTEEPVGGGGGEPADSLLE